MADPLLQGRYPIRGLYQALAVAAMCLQEQAATRPLIGDVVTALSYLASQIYDPNASNTQPQTPRSRAGSDNLSSHGDSPDLRQREAKGTNRGRKVGRDGSGGGSGRKWGLEELGIGQGSQMDSPVHLGRARDSPKNYDHDLLREQAVAEAKVWGENWRERQRKTPPGSFNGGTHE